ncbi:MAG: hypothetical protein ACRCVT_07410 [Leadbetterella sp.]
MKQLIILFGLSLCNFNTYSQEKTRITKELNDLMTYYWHVYLDSMFNYKTSNTLDQIKIVFEEHSLGFFRKTTITYRNPLWNTNIIVDGPFSNKIPAKVNLSTNVNIALDSLIKSDFFVLPNQNSLPLDKNYSVDCGMNYEITYQVANINRKYSFSNPELYLSRNSHSKELKQYIKIIEIFKSLVLPN